MNSRNDVILLATTMFEADIAMSCGHKVLLVSSEAEISQVRQNTFDNPPICLTPQPVYEYSGWNEPVQKSKTKFYDHYYKRCRR